MAAISGKLARIRYSAAVATSSTDQAATLAGGGLSVTINSTARRRWDPSVSVSEYAVALGGTPVAAAQWTPLYGTGTFQFTTAHGAGTWTVDVPWLATSYLTQAKSWVLDTNVEMLDATAFSTDANKASWRTFVPGISDATVKISRFFNSSSTGPVFIDRALLNSPFYLELVLNSTDQAQYVCYGHIEADSFSEDVGGLVAEEITFRPSGPIYYTT